MARVIDTDVLAILDTTITDFTPYIEAADAVIDSHLLDKGLSDALLKIICRWLSAHFCCINDPRTTSESAGVSESYEGRVDLGLNLSRYGQQAMTLDPTGTLAMVNGRNTRGAVPAAAQQSASITWLGGS